MTPKRASGWIGRACVTIGILFTLQACAPKQPMPVNGAGSLAASLPAYADLAARYNAHIDGLDTLWSRTVITLKYQDKDGKPTSDQVEGHFNFRRPHGLVLTFMKAGQMGGVMGCGTIEDGLEGFWWIDLQGEKHALVGGLDRVPAERLDELGIPVHPLDLIELLALTPLPTGLDGVRFERAELAGTAAIVTPGRTAGTERRVVVDLESALPRRIELLVQGRAALWAEYAKFAPIAWRDLPRAGVDRWRVPSDVTLSMDSDRVRARMTLGEPESGGSRPKVEAFRFSTWTTSYGVRNVEHLDDLRGAR